MYHVYSGEKVKVVALKGLIADSITLHKKSTELLVTLMKTDPY